MCRFAWSFHFLQERSKNKPDLSTVVSTGFHVKISSLFGHERLLWFGSRVSGREKIGSAGSDETLTSMIPQCDTT